MEIMQGCLERGFAKVLKDLALYPDGQRRRRFRKEYPAPHWRPTLVESDNRIPAHGFDTSNYQFLVPETLSSHISVTARLIYRRAYKNGWMKRLENKRYGNYSETTNSQEVISLNLTIFFTRGKRKPQLFYSSLLLHSYSSIP